eukprot:CFRG7533T1
MNRKSNIRADGHEKSGDVVSDVFEEGYAPQLNTWSPFLNLKTEASKATSSSRSEQNSTLSEKPTTSIKNENYTGGSQMKGKYGSRTVSQNTPIFSMESQTQITRNASNDLLPLKPHEEATSTFSDTTSHTHKHTAHICTPNIKMTSPSSDPEMHVGMCAHWKQSQMKSKDRRQNVFTGEVLCGVDSLLGTFFSNIPTSDVFDLINRREAQLAPFIADYKRSLWNYSGDINVDAEVEGLDDGGSVGDVGVDSCTCLNRTYIFRTHADLPFGIGKASTRITQVHRAHRPTPNSLVYTTRAIALDVPYGDRFVVDTYFQFTDVPTSSSDTQTASLGETVDTNEVEAAYGTCKKVSVQVDVAVIFVKDTWVKTAIVKSALPPVVQSAKRLSFLLTELSKLFIHESKLLYTPISRPYNPDIQALLPTLHPEIYLKVFKTDITNHSTPTDIFAFSPNGKHQPRASCVLGAVDYSSNDDDNRDEEMTYDNEDGNVLPTLLDRPGDHLSVYTSYAIILFFAGVQLTLIVVSVRAWHWIDCVSQRNEALMRELLVVSGALGLVLERGAGECESGAYDHIGGSRDVNVVENSGVSILANLRQTNSIVSDISNLKGLLRNMSSLSKQYEDRLTQLDLALGTKMGIDGDVMVNLGEGCRARGDCPVTGSSVAMGVPVHWRLIGSVVVAIVCSVLFLSRKVTMTQGPR